MNEESGTEGGDGEGSGVGFILEPALNQRTTRLSQASALEPDGVNCQLKDT